MVIGLWTLHHLDGARLLTPHGLELHHVGCVGGHAGEGGPLLWGVWRWLVGGHNLGRNATLFILYMHKNKNVMITSQSGESQAVWSNGGWASSVLEMDSSPSRTGSSGIVLSSS